MAQVLEVVAAVQLLQAQAEMVVLAAFRLVVEAAEAKRSLAHHLALVARVATV